MCRVVHRYLDCRHGRWQERVSCSRVNCHPTREKINRITYRGECTFCKAGEPHPNPTFDPFDNLARPAVRAAAAGGAAASTKASSFIEKPATKAEAEAAAGEENKTTTTGNDNKDGADDHQDRRGYGGFTDYLGREEFKGPEIADDVREEGMVQDFDQDMYAAWMANPASR